MSATCPAAGSFTVKSILHGQNLLKEGLVWRIGDGTSINIHHDNWIPREGCMWPLGKITQPGVTKAAHLLNGDGDGWNRAIVQDLFSPDDARDILSISVGGTASDDYL